MRFTLILIASAVALSGCSSTKSDFDDGHQAGGAVTALATPQHCGIDFAEEDDQAAKTAYLNSIDGEWMQYVQAFERASCADDSACFKKPGFVFDQANDQVGNVEYKFHELPEEKDAFTNFDERSTGLFKIRNLRVSKPIVSTGLHNGDRFVSFYDVTSEYCWSYAIGRRGDNLSVEYVDIVHKDQPLLSVEVATKMIEDHEQVYKHLDIAKMAGDAPAPQPAVASTPSRCGFDFNDEAQGNIRLELLAALNGNWISRDSRFDADLRTRVNDTFVFDIAEEKLGFSSIAVDAHKPDSALMLPKPVQKFDLANLRISRPLASYDNARLLSLFDPATQTCQTLTFTLDLNNDGELKASSPIASVGPLKSVHDFFSRPSSFNIFKRIK